MKTLDLFCGCGGLSAGFSQAGFDIVGGIDVDDVALRTYARNFPAARALNIDLGTEPPQHLASTVGLRPGQLTALVGGPPCQGFSKNVPARNRWLEDPKNLLMRRFLEYAEYLRPTAILMENVAEARNAFARSYSDFILDRLRDLGYEASEHVWIAAQFGVPQRRRRAFFIGLPPRRDFVQPEISHADSEDLFCSKFVTVWDAISDLDSLDAGEGASPSAYPKPAATDYQKRMRNGCRVVHDHVARPLTAIQLARLRSIREGQGARDLPRELAPRSHYSGAYGRLWRDDVAPTITRWVFHPGSGRFSHPRRDRVITIREAARLQGFPDAFTFEGTYIQKSHQVGNAVPPLMAEALARSLAASLQKASSKRRAASS